MYHYNVKKLAHIGLPQIYYASDLTHPEYINISLGLSLTSISFPFISSK